MKTQDNGAAARAAGVAVALCVFVPVFPILYSAIIFVKKLAETRNIEKAKAVAMRFWKDYADALLFTPIVKFNKKDRRPNKFPQKPRARKKG